MTRVARREFSVACNWKVFCDNYLDGGYHVPFAHPALAEGVDMRTYRTTWAEARGHATQTVGGGFRARGVETCLLYTSPSPRDATLSRMPSSA